MSWPLGYGSNRPPCGLVLSKWNVSIEALHRQRLHVSVPCLTSCGGTSLQGSLYELVLMCSAFRYQDLMAWGNITLVTSFCKVSLFDCLASDQFLTLSAIRQFLVCFQARGAPGEGQGNPGARGRPEDLEKLLEPKENLERKFSYGPIWAIKQMRNCHQAG